SAANANCQAAIPIAARQTPIVRLQSRLQRGKRQLSDCNPDCSVANANCQAAIPIAARQTPIVRLQLQPVIDVRNPHVVRTADYLEVIEHLGGLNLGDPEDRLG
ncbi:MAG: hypothetical protein DMG16_02745, partial [Acidobacteria bacterium]